MSEAGPEFNIETCTVLRENNRLHRKPMQTNDIYAINSFRVNEATR